MVAGGASPRSLITLSQISCNRVAVTQDANTPKRDNGSVKAGFQTPSWPHHLGRQDVTSSPVRGIWSFPLL